MWWWLLFGISVVLIIGLSHKRIYEQCRKSPFGVTWEWGFNDYP